MDKSNGKDLFSKTINTVTEEGAKAYTISKSKLEISSIKKAVSEKERRLLDKLYTSIEKGEIDRELFVPEYESIMKLNKDITLLSTDIENIKDNTRLPIRQISGFAKGFANEGKKIFDKVADKISDKFDNGLR